MAIRTYGIPRVVEAREIFTFNGGKGQLPIVFSGGIPDPKYQIPATYSTSNQFEQMVIESSPLFGQKVFRYGLKGEVIASRSLADIVSDVESGKPSKRLENAKKEKSKVYENVETIGEATEILLDLGAKADELTSADAVISTMMRMKVAFPNLKTN